MGLIGRFFNKAPISEKNKDDTDNFGFIRPDLQGKQAVYPAWFFSATYGQPRGIDINELRTFSKSSWVQMVLTTIKKEVSNIPWEVVNADEEDKTDYSEQIKTVTDFLNNINLNNDTIEDINSELVTDIGEIDAGVLNLVYSNDSYEMGKYPIYDATGKIVGGYPMPILKEFGKRQLVAVKTADGGSMLKQVDLHKNILGYYQYSFKSPVQNPTPFQREEIVYLSLNKRPYSIYGFSPIESVQQVLELLIQGTRWNKDFFKNGAIPDILVSLPKLDTEELKKLRRIWDNQFKGKPHPVGFINWAIDQVVKLNNTNKDMEWLEGQKWYYHLVFACCGVSPSEAGFFESSNQATDENQSRVTIRNAVKPYMKILERAINQRIIKEILQEENPKIKFKYFPKDHAEEKIEFEQNMKKLENGVMTINEYRALEGKDSVEWGDEPLRRPIDLNQLVPNANNPQQKNKPDSKEIDGKKYIKFTKAFEDYMNGKSTNSEPIKQ
jgi:HK97 family phage portal protein